MRASRLVLAAVIAALTTAAAAQTTQSPAPPTRVRGTVERLDGDTLIVHAREGKEVAVTLAADTGISGMAKKSLGDIKVGDFIGSAAVKSTDGMLQAQEVVIFPEMARGTGEGHYPWDLTPDSTMTNATVAEVVAAPDGRHLHVKYKGGEKDIDVGADVPVVTFVAGDRSLLAPGTAVFIIATPRADGGLDARRVAAAKDGVAPPM